jgi:hypothetical protein
MTPLRIALSTYGANPRGGVVHTLERAAALSMPWHVAPARVPTHGCED